MRPEGRAELLKSDEPRIWPLRAVARGQQLVGDLRVSIRIVRNVLPAACSGDSYVDGGSGGAGAGEEAYGPADKPADGAAKECSHTS